ncbi:MAG: type II toxin-antitoxin system Phd/YefM family antitoxin [Xanthomonadales bacterium]|nr:type II toxin-antitoxin system Phd/YefM family antitoxin [Xanthomonadales bacterium]
MNTGRIMESRVSKSQFKAKALEIFRQVEASGSSVIITDHGRPTIEVRPYHQQNHNPLDILKGSVSDYIDPLEPVGRDDWAVLK